MAQFSWTTLRELELQLTAEIEKVYPDEIIEFSVTLDGDRFVMTGTVASEACRTAAHRKLLGFDRVFKVDNQITVTAYLYPADDGHMSRRARNGDRDRSGNSYGGDTGFRGGTTSFGLERDFVTGGGGAPRRRTRVSPPPVRTERRSGTVGQEANGKQEVVRRPVIRTDGPVRYDQKIEILVELPEYDQEKPSERVSLGTHEPGWGSLKIAVQIASAGLRDIAPESALITVNEDGTSEPAVFQATICGKDQAVQVDAAFFHGTRFCGSASETFPLQTVAGAGIDADKTAKQEVLEDAGLHSYRAGVAIVPKAFGPDLNVTILPKAEGVQLWTWQSSYPTGHSETHGETVLGKSPEQFAISLLKACPTWDKAIHRDRMRTVGERIWDAAPLAFRTAYLGLRQRLGPAFSIQFITDELWIPWELMKSPDEPVMDHLSLSHPVARWALTNGGHMEHELPSGQNYTFAPQYGLKDDLPGARKERDLLKGKYAALEGLCSREAFINLLKGTTAQSPVGIIHFAGHGQADSGERDNGIWLSDGLITVDDIDNSSIKLGERDRSLLIINACEVGTQKIQLGFNAGWASAIVRRRFGGLLAALWEVEDGAAFELLDTTLNALLAQRSSLGEAVLAGRKSTADASISSFAYVIHGDVMAKVARH